MQADILAVKKHFVNNTMLSSLPLYIESCRYTKLNRGTIPPFYEHARDYEAKAMRINSSTNIARYYPKGTLFE
jgi:hypothetical protein